MQLYYMKKDGTKISSASVVLMAVAVIYKFVLALTGIGIILFCKTEKILICVKVWKKSDLRKGKMDQFLSEYQETVGAPRMISLSINAAIPSAAAAFKNTWQRPFFFLDYADRDLHILASLFRMQFFLILYS